VGEARAAAATAWEGDCVGVEVGAGVDVGNSAVGVAGGAVGVGSGVSGGMGVAVGVEVDAAVGGATGADSAPQIASKARAGGETEPSPHTQPSISPLPTVHVAAPIPE